MRSSPSFLVVSRSEGNGDGRADHSRSEDWPEKPFLFRYARSDPGRGEWREPLEIALSRKGVATLVVALYILDLSVEVLARVVGLF